MINDNCGGVCANRWEISLHDTRLLWNVCKECGRRRTLNNIRCHQKKKNFQAQRQNTDWLQLLKCEYLQSYMLNVTVEEVTSGFEKLVDISFHNNIVVISIGNLKNKIAITWFHLLNFISECWMLKCMTGICYIRVWTRKIERNREMCNYKQ